MKLKESSDHFGFYKVEHGIQGECWTQWNFESCFGIDQVNQLVERIPSNHLIKVYAQSRYSLDWTKVKQFRKLTLIH